MPPLFVVTPGWGSSVSIFRGASGCWECGWESWRGCSPKSPPGSRLSVAGCAPMDPLAHTLFGAALAESGLKRRSRYATATLLIGANLPDIDAMAGLWGSDFELYARRGHTHGILAMLVLPLLLAGAMMLWHRWRSGTADATRRSGEHPRIAARSVAGADALPLQPRVLLALAFLAIWSHPLLDWMNTYGVRLLMPFDGRWFYGDTLFIVDPWFWLLAAAGVVLARSASGRAIAGWLL